MPLELQQILHCVRRRWRLRFACARLAAGAGCVAAVLLAGWAASALLSATGLPLVFLTGAVLALAFAVLVRAAWPLRRAPSDAQVARFIEERVSGLDDVVVTAVEYGSRREQRQATRQALSAAAVRSLCAADTPMLDAIVSRRSVARQMLLATAAVALAVGAGVLLRPDVLRASDVAAAHLFPARVTLHVLPGSAKVRAGSALTISVQTSAGVTPILTVRDEKETRTLPLQTNAEGVYSALVPDVQTAFTYDVRAASLQSTAFAVEVVRPPRVTRIDVRYDYPQSTRMPSRVEEDGGDIFGPQGTAVGLRVTADKPISRASLVLNTGDTVPLAGADQEVHGTLRIVRDGSYRIALVDADGLESSADAEYFIRTLDDRPPDVQIVRPAADKQVTALEEVAIAATAADDFGIAALDLVMQAPNGAERAVALARGGTAPTVEALHTLALEELALQPGDFVTYFARARDVNRGRGSREARSDIFFLEVKAFDEEFAAAQSQATGAGAGMQQTGLEVLVAAQKQVIVATWNLDARARRAASTVPPADVRSVAATQSDIRERTVQAAAQGVRLGFRRGRDGSGGGDAIGQAITAMTQATRELQQGDARTALPHEREALNQLLRAQAEQRRRQVARSQQASGSGGGQNRSEADLSALFDHELRKRQQTNYETPSSTEAHDEQPRDDPAERIRDLARRQDALNGRQQELTRRVPQPLESEQQRQLERLTREQQALSAEAQRLAEQGQRSSDAPGAAGAKGGNHAGQRLREASEDMRAAASGLSAGNQAQARERGARAAQGLRDLERELQSGRPDGRRRLLGDAQLEARQLADAQRQLAQETSRTTATAHDSSPASSADNAARAADSGRRLAAEQHKLAERAERLRKELQRLATAGGPARPQEQRATEDAARQLNAQDVDARMRTLAEQLRGRPRSTASAARDRIARAQQDAARVLERAAETLAGAGTTDAAAQEGSRQLAQARELRDALTQIERGLGELQRAASSGQEPAKPAESPSSPASAATSSASRGQAADVNDRLAQLQQDVNAQMRAAAQLAATLRRDHEAMQTPANDSWWRVFSAPGTEAFKQDFSRWTALKRHLDVALQTVERDASARVRARADQQRLTAGRQQELSAEYRLIVEQYYRSLASPRPPR